MSVAPNSGIIDFSTFTPPSGGQDGIQGQVPKPLAGQGGYVLTGNGWSSLGALGVISYQGTWNAATNTPTIVSGVGTQGYYYVVSVAGTTTIDGISNWGVGDWIIFNGSTWQKIEGGSQGNFTTLDVTGLATLATVDINGGTIDGTSIGSTTPSTGSFTQLTAQQVAVRGGVNLLLRSQEFNDAVWQKTGAGTGSAPVVTANAGTAPDGTLTADRVQFALNGGTTTSDQSILSQSFTFAATNYAISFYIKSNTASNFTVSLVVEGIQVFPTLTVTPSWQRFSVVRTATGLSSSVQLRLRGTVTGDTADILVWGAQLEPGAVVNTYVPTTSSAITIENKLQVTGQAAIEGNLITQDLILQGGNNFVNYTTCSTTGWTGLNATGTNNNAIAPDGTLTATLWTGTSAGINRVYSASTPTLTSGVTYTASIYVKQPDTNAAQYIRLYVDQSTEAASGWVAASFNFATGVATGVGASAVPVGNGWYRLISTSATTVTATCRMFFGIANSSGNATTSTNSVLWWGAQLEIGTVASPYTPVSAAATIATTNDILVPSGSVGIGTSSPGSALHLNNPSASGDTPRIRFTNTATGVTATDGSFVGISNNNQLDLFNYESAAVRLATNGAVRLFISNGGVVFVGNDEINASPTNGFISGTGGSGTNINGATLTIQGGRGTGTGAGGPIILQTAPTGTTGTTLNSAIERMRIDSSGNLLVGTTATLGAAGLTLNNASNYFGLNLAVNGSLQGRLFQEATGNIYLDAGTTNTNGALVFRTNSGTERMRITPVGSAVIAQTWDKGTGRLQVTGQAAVEGNVVAQDVIVQGGNNLVQRSADFSDVYWNKLDSTATTNVVASPDGTTTANSLVENSATGRHGFVRNIATLTGSIYTISIYAKQNTRRYFTVSLKNVSPVTPRYSVTFDLQLGTVGQADSAGTPANTSNSITSVGNGWYRLAVSMQASSTSTNFEFGLATSGTFGAGSEGLQSYTGDGTSGVYIWGAQLELGTVASPYTPTTTAAVTTSNDLLVPSGNVGIGTSSPSALLELRKASPTTLVMSHTNGTGYETTISANYNAAESFSITSNTMKILSCVPNAIGGNGAVVLGSAANVVRVAGSSTLAVGSGDESASPVAGIIRGANGTGTDITGATLTIQGGRGTGAAAGGPLIFSTAAAGTTGTTLNAVTERMRITPTGSIGIGRSIPTFYSANATTVSLDGTSGSYVDFYFNGTRTGLIYSENTRFILDTVGAVPIIIRTGLTERMRVTDTGNVGIGTTTPARTLEVLATSSSMVAQFRSGSGNNGFICFSNTNSTADQVRIGSTDGNLVLSTNYTERMRIDSSGNVGIGITPNTWGAGSKVIQLGATTSLWDTGANSFITNNNYNDGSNKYITTGYAGRYGISSSTGAHTWQVAASGTAGAAITFTEAMRITDTGDVGIGTSSPAFSLAISRTGSNPTFALTRTDASVAGSLRFEEGNSGAFINQFGSKFLALQTANTERMRITSAGDVGIGTTSPTTYTGHTSLSINNATNGGLIDLLTNGTRHLTLYAGSGSSTIGTASATDLVFLTNSTERVRINSNGNVGIGTSSPSSTYRLTINGVGTSGNPIGGIIFQQGGTTTGFIGNISTTNSTDFEVYNPRNGYLRFATNNVERVRINSSGELIIGNGDTVGSANNGLLRATNGLGTDITGATLTIQGGRGTGTGAGGPIVFSTSAAGTTGTTLNAATERMRVTSAGDVGIGTASPGAKLDVSGTAQASQLRAATAYTVATLPTASAGMIARVTDGDAALAWGATVVNSGAGATPYLVWYNGTNWTVMGK